MGGKKGRGRFGQGGGGGGIAKQPRGGGGFQQDGNAKAVRRACEQDDVHTALRSDPQTFGHDATTVSMLLNLLLRKGHLAEAVGLLGHYNCTALPFAKTMQALDGLTQTVKLEEEAAVALVAAAVTNAGLNPAERAAASFFVAQAGYVVLEFVAEGIAAHTAIETQPLDVLRRMGKAAVVRCAPKPKPKPNPNPNLTLALALALTLTLTRCAPGKKKGEVLCAHEGGGGFNGGAGARDRSVQANPNPNPNPNPNQEPAIGACRAGTACAWRRWRTSAGPAAATAAAAWAGWAATRCPSSRRRCATPRRSCSS